MRNGTVSPRQPSAPLTRAIVSTCSLPTPTAAEHGSSQNGINGIGGANERPSANKASLSTLARDGRIPTPTASDAKATGMGATGVTLSDAAVRGRRYPTRRASDATKGAATRPEREGTAVGDCRPRSRATTRRPATTRVATPLTRAVTDCESDSPSSAPSAPSDGDGTLRLNPRFVEWMMGWPLGWTETMPPASMPSTSRTASTPSATASSTSEQHTLGLSSPIDSTTDPGEDDAELAAPRVGDGRRRDPDDLKAHRETRANVKRMDTRRGLRGARAVEDFERATNQVSASRDRRSNPSRSVPHRIEGAGGDWPDRASDERRAPRPPAILVLYPDIVEELAPAPVYGQYPRGFIERMLPWLGCQRSEVLHLCSGCLPKGEGIRVDIRPEARPDIVADVTRLPLRDSSVAAVMADPPYSPDYAKSLYGVKYPRPSHVLREAVRVVRPGGMIVFVHYITPRPPPGASFVRAWAASTGFDMPIRAVSLYRKDGATLALEAPP